MIMFAIKAFIAISAPFACAFALYALYYILLAVLFILHRVCKGKFTFFQYVEYFENYIEKNVFKI